MTLTFDSLTIIDEKGQYHVPKPQLIKLAEQILELFIQRRPNYVPGHVRVPRQTLIQFYWAAQKCYDQGISAEVYIDRQLERMARIGQFWPQAIAAELSAYDSDRKDPLYGIHFYRTQINLFVERGKIFGECVAISDTNNDFSPLFRCVMANKLGLSDVVNRFYLDAKFELAALPIASEIFGESVDFLRCEND